MADRVVRDIRRKTRQRHSTEEKIRIELEGLRGDESIADGPLRRATELFGAKIGNADRSKSQAGARAELQRQITKLEQVGVLQVLRDKAKNGTETPWYVLDRSRAERFINPFAGFSGEPMSSQVGTSATRVRPG